MSVLPDDQNPALALLREIRNESNPTVSVVPVEAPQHAGAEVIETPDAHAVVHLAEAAPKVRQGPQAPCARCRTTIATTFIPGVSASEADQVRIAVCTECSRDVDAEATAMIADVTAAVRRLSPTLPEVRIGDRDSRIKYLEAIDDGLARDPQMAPVRTLADRSGEWSDYSLCATSDVDFFDPNQQAQAIKMCERCPVRLRCLASALVAPSGSQDGIWAGTKPAQRRRINNPKAE